ncbi:MAG: hypothetical protein SV765_17500 [Pseudomonadota bacterium]|nr:hypothetical protein [Pseudomonadota bacterium]
MSFFRTPSPLEFTYIAADLPHYSPLVNQFFLVGEGDIDEELLHQAMCQAVQANPGIGLRLRGYWGWRYWDSNAPQPSLGTIDASDWSGQSSEGAPCLGAPIDLRREPAFQVTKIRTRKHIYLLFRTHHAVSDGRGTVHLLNDVFRALRNEPLVGSASRITEWDIAMREQRPERTVTEHNCLPVIQGTVNEAMAGCQWYRFDWHGDKNKFAAKIIYACAQLAWQHFGDGKVFFRIPADLRRYMEPDEGFTVANCTGALDMEIEPDASLNNIRTQIVRAMRNRTDLSPFQENHKYVKWLPKAMFRLHPETLRRMHREKRYRMSGIISYVGDVDINQFAVEGFRPVSQFGVPIPFENRPLFVGASTFNNLTHIIVGAPRAACSMAELKAFCGELSGALDAL